MMNDLYYNHMSGCSFGGGLLTILFWILIVVIIVKLLRHSTTHSDYFELHRSRHIHNILRQRYAKGEISKEEFEEKKKYLIG